MRGLFVTGTDTGVGKTILSAALIAAMVAAGERVRAHKPVMTGLDEPDSQLWPPDHVLLARAAGMDPRAVAPLRYDPAVSPHLAAELAGERIDPARMLAAVRGGTEAHDGAGGERDGDREEIVVVEGVGGLLVPLVERFTVRDLAVELGFPLLLAARPGLGTINHTLLTLQAARSAGLDVRAVVLTPWPSEPSGIERSNRTTIERFGGVEVGSLGPIQAPDLGELARAGEQLPWRRWLRSD
jgi:dethiobiotin synthetase